MPTSRGELKRVHVQLKRLGLTLATAESCTAGWVAKLLTDFSGSSEYFKGAIVAYRNSIKRKLLGIPVREKQSAVTRSVAVEMARRARKNFETDLAVATTGYMEPATCVPKRFTGVAYVAVAARRNRCDALRVVKLFLNGTRRQNRVSTSNAAVHLLGQVINDFSRKGAQT